MRDGEIRFLRRQDKYQVSVARRPDPSTQDIYPHIFRSLLPAHTAIGLEVHGAVGREDDDGNIAMP